MHTFLYQFKLIFRDRILLFWTLIFPLILATFFNLAFSQLTSNEGFEPSKLVIIEEKENKELKNLLEELSKKNDAQLLDIQYASSLSSAESLLKDEKIDGYLIMNDELKIKVNENSVSSTIIQSVVDSYQQVTHSMNTIAMQDPQAFLELVQEKIDTNHNYFQSENITSLNATVVYFYTLIGMTCMYGGFFGLKISTLVEANLSRQGTRMNVAPVSKMKVILTGDIAAFIWQYFSVMILLCYLIFGLNIDFGQQTGYILLLSGVGTFVGVTIGNLIGNLFHCSENTKVSILSSSSLFLSFLSGMMILDMKYWIQEYAPVLSYINPVSLITDALYALYYYPTHERFFFNVFILLSIGVLLTVISIFVSRRKKYVSL